MLGAVLPGYDADVISRGLLGETPIEGLTFPTFSGQECRLSGHCFEFGGYFAAYGVLTASPPPAWLALGASAGDHEPASALPRSLADDRRGALRRASWSPTSRAPTRRTAWILTRFIEVPYYALVAFAAIALVGLAQHR